MAVEGSRKLKKYKVTTPNSCYEVEANTFEVAGRKIVFYVRDEIVGMVNVENICSFHLSELSIQEEGRAPLDPALLFEQEKEKLIQTCSPNAEDTFGKLG